MSPDGRFWWNGQEWTPVAALEQDRLPAPTTPQAAEPAGGMRPCRTCGQAVGTSASTCPQCGTRRPALEARQLPRRAPRWLVLALVALMLGGWLAGGYFSTSAGTAERLRDDLSVSYGGSSYQPSRAELEDLEQRANSHSEAAFLLNVLGTFGAMGLAGAVVMSIRARRY